MRRNFWIVEVPNETTLILFIVYEKTITILNHQSDLALKNGETNRSVVILS